MSKPKRLAICHPDKPYFVKGLCKSCDQRKRNLELTPEAKQRNHGLGSFKDNPEWLLKASFYLKTHNIKKVDHGYLEG